MYVPKRFSDNVHSIGRLEQNACYIIRESWLYLLTHRQNQIPFISSKVNILLFYFVY